MKVAFSFSLLLGAIGWGQDEAPSLRGSLKNEAPVKVLEGLAQRSKRGDLPGDVAREILSLHSSHSTREMTDRELSKRLERIATMFELHSQASSEKPPESVGEIAKDVKKSPIYQDPGKRERANWLAGAASRLERLKFDPECNTRDLDANMPANMPGWTLSAVYWLLGIGVLVFIFFAARHFAWARSLERKAKAMLDDDEPERTVDEWLALATGLESEGKFREAIRCLYLACLLRIDEARIARFERGQTNWEHLARIEASPTKPLSLDFRPPTKAFDVAWYGMRDGGAPQVAQFKQWYREITEIGRAKAA